MTQDEPISITAEQFTAAMEAAVADKGEEYVYPFESPQRGGCFYRDGDTPLCIVGDALSRILTPDQFRGLVPDRHNDAAGPTALGLLTRKYFNVDYRVISAAQSAQGAQDDGLTWGEALRKYKRNLGVA